MSISRHSFPRLVLTGAIALLTACGGGGGGGEAPASTVSTGTLTDSAVGGVSYTTSSGLSGVTDAAGHFQYKPGDTVTFRIGALSLGTVTTSGTTATITPLQIAEATGGLTATEAENLVTNLLVLLQSLDSDGDASNGISISDTASAALTVEVVAALDLVADPATFAGSTGLTDLAGAAGTTPVDPATALAHFKEQFMVQLAGSYYYEQDGELITLDIDATGLYQFGNLGSSSDPGALQGVERGTIDWSPLTGEITATVDAAVDTNGTAGLSDPQPGEHLFFSLDGEDLVVRSTNDDAAIPAETTTLTNVPNGKGILGAWSLPGGQRLYFMPSGAFAMVDPVGDTESTHCGDPGVERGSYHFNGSVITFSGVTVDTNGCAGTHVNDPGADDDNTYLVFHISSNDGETMTATLATGDSFQMTRTLL